MTKFLNIIVALVLPTMIFSQAATAQTVSANIKTKKAETFKHKSLGWKFTIPSSWGKDTVVEKSNQILVLSKNKSKNIFKASLHPVPKANEETLKNYIGFLKRKIEADIKSLDLTITFKDEVKTISDKKFHCLDYKITDGQGQLITLYNSYYSIEGNSIFEVTINTEDHGKQAEIVSAWAASVKSIK